MSDKLIALQSIEYAKKLLNRFKKVLNGGQDSFSELEINDLSDMLGLEYEEIIKFIK